MPPRFNTKVFLEQNSKFFWGLLLLTAKVPTFYLHVTEEVQVENKREFVDLKTKISFCFILI